MSTGKKGDSRSGLYFLVFVVAIYLVLFLLKPEKTLPALRASGNMLVRILPIFVLVVFFMGIMNYLLTPKTISRYVGQGSGIKGWLLATSTGILSHGPIYAWYPLLRDLRVQGMRSGLAAAFLYNRSIKIPLLPMMVYYFGIKFALVLLLFMMIASLAEGKLIELFER